MCYYTHQQSDKKTLERRFKAKFKEEEVGLGLGKVSGFQHPNLPIQTQAKPEWIQSISWGLIPGWADADQAEFLRKKTLNARSEEVWEKPSFAPSLLKQKCLVLVDGFYEWQQRGKDKLEYLIQLKTPGPFALAGIYSIYRKGDAWVASFSILTTAANALMEEIHNTKKRMPLILPPDKEQAWLQAQEEEEIKALMQVYPAEGMQANPQHRKPLDLFTLDGF